MIRTIALWIMGLLGLAGALTAQDSHYQESWPYVKMNYKTSEHYQISTNIIGRFDNQTSGNKDVFIEPGIQRKFKGGFAVEGVYRLIWRPELTDAHVLFLHLNYKKRLSGLPIRLENRLRLHYGLDVNEVTAADFLRDRLRCRFDLAEGFDMMVGSEPYLSWKDGLNLALFRYEAGFNFHPTKVWNLQILYRLQDAYKELGTTHQHIWVMGFSYNLPFSPLVAAP